MTRVLHTGDTHVGYRQYHEPERRADFLRAFERVIEDAIDEDVDAVVHAGDLFHDRRPDLQDLQGVVAALRELSAAGIPFLAIVGNHEAKRSGQWLDLFADLDLAERLGDQPRVVGDLALYGLDHVPRSQRDALEYEFADHDADRAALVAHGLFTPFDPGEWNAADLLDRATVDFDAMLLGDNHDPGKQRVEETWVTYPGSTERASASERADRGYNLVTVEDGDLRITRRTIETREFVFVDVELAEGEGGDVVRDRVREFDHEGAVTVVGIDGEGEPVTPGPIEELALEQGALVARVNDRRDVETEAGDLEVSFADPDDAVRQRLRELGLSEAARDLDGVIRDDTVADANVRERARRRVDEHLDAELDAFEPLPAEEADGADAAGDSSESGESDRSEDEAVAPDGDAAGDAGGAAGDAGESAEADESIATDESTEAGGESGEDVGESSDDAGESGEDAPESAEADDGATNDTGDAADDADEATDGAPADPDQDEPEPDDELGSDDDAGADPDDEGATHAADGQASMEEYL